MGNSICYHFVNLHFSNTTPHNFRTTYYKIERITDGNPNIGTSKTLNRIPTTITINKNNNANPNR